MAGFVGPFESIYMGISWGKKEKNETITKAFWVRR